MDDPEEPQGDFTVGEVYDLHQKIRKLFQPDLEGIGTGHIPEGEEFTTPELDIMAAMTLRVGNILLMPFTMVSTEGVEEGVIFFALALNETTIGMYYFNQDGLVLFHQMIGDYLEWRATNG